ncbi:MAG: AMP-binding protein, partial [Candidatus Omnitrophota bacterium]
MGKFCFACLKQVGKTWVKYINTAFTLFLNFTIIIIMNVKEILEQRATEYPLKTAVIFRGQSISFHQLKEFSFRLSNSLIKLGIKKGDKVALYLPNCPEYIYSYLAVWS